MMIMQNISRRNLLLGGFGLAGLGALAACTSNTPAVTSATGGPTTATMPTSPPPGQKLVTKTLTPRPVTWDLGGVQAKTWAYADTPDAGLIRVKAGDLLRIDVKNQLPTETSVHWHGIRLPNAADGVPGVTQKPIAPGQTFRYEFTTPDPGTYFFHPHSGVQIDRGLYAPIIVDDPHEPGKYDAEWIVLLDDWTDGVGTSPDDILKGFQAQGGTVTTGMNMNGMRMGGPSGSGMGGMMGGSTGGSGMGNMGGMGNSPLGDAGDVAYPYYLVNGRIPAQPTTFTGKPGQKVRIRFINAGSDTIFKVGLGGHTMSVTHSDGFPVKPTDTKALYIAMGERYDVLVTLGDGVFPLVALAEGKKGRAQALVRTSSGTAPAADVSIPEVSGSALLGSTLTPLDSAKLPSKNPDSTVTFELNGQMKPYAWGINGKKFGQDTPTPVSQGQRLRMRMTNMTMMAHPMHVHGHTWSLPASGGLRKDTVLVLPMQTIEADLQADNPGTWMFHCHNIYHAELGMMTSLKYV